MGVQAPLDESGITHGICSPCYTHMTARMSLKPLPESVESLDKAVVVIDVDGRFMTCNRRAEEMLGSRKDLFLGYLSGEFFECDHARSVPGCGKNLSCPECPIRKTVARTRDTGVSLEGIPAFLNTRAGGKSLRRKLVISTEKDGEYVRLRIDSIS